MEENVFDEQKIFWSGDSESVKSGRGLGVISCLACDRQRSSSGAGDPVPRAQLGPGRVCCYTERPGFQKFSSEGVQVEQRRNNAEISSVGTCGGGRGV